MPKKLKSVPSSAARLIGRRCGACGYITSEVCYQAMKFVMPCPNPKCSDPKRAYAEEVYEPISAEPKP